MGKWRNGATYTVPLLTSRRTHLLECYKHSKAAADYRMQAIAFTHLAREHTRKGEWHEAYKLASNAFYTLMARPSEYRNYRLAHRLGDILAGKRPHQCS